MPKNPQQYNEVPRKGRTRVQPASIFANNKWKSRPAKYLY